jgi:hypothetical protein
LTPATAFLRTRQHAVGVLPQHAGPPPVPFGVVVVTMPGNPPTVMIRHDRHSADLRQVESQTIERLIRVRPPSPALPAAPDTNLAFNTDRAAMHLERRMRFTARSAVKVRSISSWLGRRLPFGAKNMTG